VAVILTRHGRSVKDQPALRPRSLAFGLSEGILREMSDAPRPQQGKSSMPAPAKVLELIEVFERHADEYTSPDFKEVMLREPFINPLFKSLGWDMENEPGRAEA
jgi:hypothetical protein